MKRLVKDRNQDWRDVARGWCVPSINWVVETTNKIFVNDFYFQCCVYMNMNGKVRVSKKSARPDSRSRVSGLRQIKVYVAVV